MSLYRSYSRSNMGVDHRSRSGSVVKRSSSFVGSFPLGRSSSRLFSPQPSPTRSSYSTPTAYSSYSSYTPTRSSSVYYSERFPHVRYSNANFIPTQPSLPVYTSYSRPPSRFEYSQPPRSYRPSSNYSYSSPTRSASFSGFSRSPNIDNVIGLYTRSHMTANTLSKYFLTSSHRSSDYSAYQYHPVVEVSRSAHWSSGRRVRF